jgi:hypothetical protein
LNDWFDRLVFNSIQLFGEKDAPMCIDHSRCYSDDPCSLFGGIKCFCSAYRGSAGHSAAHCNGVAKYTASTSHSEAYFDHCTAICDQDPPVKGVKDYCQVLESLGAICGKYSIERDGLIVTAKQRAPNFVAGVVQVIMELTGQP